MLGFIHIPFQCQHNLSSSAQNQISTVETAVRLQKTAATSLTPPPQDGPHCTHMMLLQRRSMQSWQDGLNFSHFTVKKQKHSHVSDNGRVRLRGNTDFWCVIIKKSFLFFSLRHCKVFEPAPKLFDSSFWSQYWFYLGFFFYNLQKNLQTTITNEFSEFSGAQGI